jgi:hypothetical protein
MTYVPSSREAQEKDDGDSQGHAPVAASGVDESRLFLAGVGAHVYGGQKTVAAASESLNKAGIFSGITDGVAQTLDGGVQAVVEIHKCINRPEPAAQFFPGNDFPGMLEEHGQDLERLLLESHLDAVPAELTGTEIHFEDAEADDAVSPVLWHQ